LGQIGRLADCRVFGVVDAIHKLAHFRALGPYAPSART
jgi:hypothetical protein